MKHTIILFKRLMTHITRSPETIISAMIQPTLIMLLFVFVFGGAIKASLPESINYVNFQLPGILIMAISYNTSYTALRMYSDRQKGIFNRFNSMPINRSSTLWAHVLTSITSSLFTVMITFIFAFIIGFRTDVGIIQWLSVLGILILLTLALTWVAVLPGLIAKTNEGAQFLAFPLVFLPMFSSAFAPTETMPKALRVFAENQPMTSIVESVRALLNNEPVGNNIWIAMMWCVVIMVVFWLIAMKAYKQHV